MPPWLAITVAVILLILNGFFVAAEFAFVKVRKSRLEKLVKEKRLFAGTVRWLHDRLDNALSCCQLGITIASLVLGSVAEPAFESFLEPLLHMVGIDNHKVVQAISYTVAISVVTALHLVVGEQGAKDFRDSSAGKNGVVVCCSTSVFLLHALSIYDRPQLLHNLVVETGRRDGKWWPRSTA